VRSNRATLLWVLPACAAAVLFADDLVTLVLGDAWRPARPLVQGLAVAAAMGQLGFNWFSFYRAHERTRPPAVEAVVAAVAFLALAVPGLAVAGVTGFIVGRCAAVAIQLCVRARYVHALLPAVRPRDLLGRTLIPTAAGAAAALALRAALWGSGRPHAQTIAEVVLFGAVVVALSLRLERALLRELVSAMRRAGPAEQQPGEGDHDERDRGHLPVPVQAGVQGAGERGRGGPGGEGAVGA
jgi:O-antigen/teichoic acid export membrane protein